MAPKDQIKSMIQAELDDAMRHSFSDRKIDRDSVERADKLADAIICIILDTLDD